MKNGSESVVHVVVAGSDVISGGISKNAKYPNKPFVPSLVSQWQCKAVSLVDELRQGIASAPPLASFFVQHAVFVKAEAKLDPARYPKTGFPQKNSRLTSRKE